jgi:S-adenosylmethionine decarboxylase
MTHCPPGADVGTGAFVDLVDARDIDLTGTGGRIDLAPSILRQRLVIEGLVEHEISDRDITTYLARLSDVCGMTVLAEPVTHRSDRYGWAGWIHWESSGAHFYAWAEPEPFFSVDIYTCKAFSPVSAIKFTAEFFSATAISAKEW